MARRQVTDMTLASDAPNGRDTDRPDVFDVGPNRDDSAGVEFEDEARQPIGARPRSILTASGEAGVEAGETDDGLSGTEEAVRHAAEDIPDQEGRRRELPVVDEAAAPPEMWADEREDEEEGEEDEEDESEDEDDEQNEDDDEDEENDAGDE